MGGMTPRRSLFEIFLVALRLGCTSFGGPIAHLAYFRAEYVTKRRWLAEAQYADLVALCQFLPGPASSQAGFGIGYSQRGMAGGLAAWAGFTLPSAILMIGFAYGLTMLGDIGSAGWLRGLKAAAVAVVAHAVWSMGISLCPDWPRRLLAASAAALLLWVPSAGSQIAVIAGGAMMGWILLRETPAASRDGRDAATPPMPASTNNFAAPACLLVFLLLLGSLPWLSTATGHPSVEMVDRFYRAGSMVFGGGHVVLPLLEREVVAPGWVTPDQFLAGYGAAQALPGPLFTFSAYLGAVMAHGPGGTLGGAFALAAIFLPALLLVAGVLPYWQQLRRRPGAQSALQGANAAVVGLLLAALIHPVGTAGIVDLATLVMALGGFIALVSGKVPAWAVVLTAALVGAWVR
jgi:chromate transporter